MRRALLNLREAGDILLVSSYELGHQPLAVASTAAFLERAGYKPAVLDLSVEKPTEGALHRARFVGVSVPMHTALRLGVRFARRARALAPSAHICFYGLYAALNARYLLDELADSAIGGEFEGPLIELVEVLALGGPIEDVPAVALRGRPARPHLAKLAFPMPSRSLLPALDRYAELEADGRRRTAGAVEASRGCLHECRHCPIPPVYEGRFFVVPREVVLRDIRQLAEAGATHITFADPDFLNGPGHSCAIVAAMHAELPELTFDFTTKVSHILKHRAVFPGMAASGCLFVVSAVESLSDVVLTHLRKGHTREDVASALEVLRDAGVALRPSLVSFTPWTSLRDYLDVLDWVEDEDLVDHIDPVQFSIRLLVPPGSLLADLPQMRAHMGALEQENFSYAWSHPDPRMDRLHRDVSLLVHEAALSGEDPAEIFRHIRILAEAAAGTEPRLSPFLPARERARPPRLTEPWFC